MTDYRAKNNELIRRIHDGDEAARSELIEVNKGLIYRYIRKLMLSDVTLRNSPTVDWDDLFQAGAIGLLHAAELFDFSRNVAFSTYASLWIKQAVDREAISNGRSIRVPNYVNDARKQISVAMRDFRGKPTDDEIAAATGLTKSKVEATRMAPYVHSIHEKLKADTETERGDLIPSKELPSTEELAVAELEAQELREALDEALDSLTALEQTVVRNLYGIGRTQRGVKTTAQRLKRSHHTVNRLLASAEKKLAEHPRLRAAVLNDDKEQT